MVNSSIMIDSWLSIHTNNVISGFLGTLKHHPEWEQIYIISPWISKFDSRAGLSFEDFLHRICNCRARTFLATRPPEHDWHKEALNKLAETKQVSIVTIPGLHTKLYHAITTTASFAMFGSANMTSRSIENIEFGAVILGQGAGERICNKLFNHASQLYLTKSREIFCKASLR